MAIIHQAQITPSKRDIVHAWLDRQDWGGTGETEVIGSYRFDDPDGEVGVEAMIVRRGNTMLHVPLTYRAAPLPGAESHCLGTAHHSVLGKRWVHDATADPVALGCFARALRSEQPQAIMEVWDGDTLIETREPNVRVRVEAGSSTETTNTGATMAEVDGSQLYLMRMIGADVDGRQRLIAEWADGQAVVATLC